MIGAMLNVLAFFYREKLKLKETHFIVGIYIYERTTDICVYPQLINWKCQI